jgi:hypothetical protein
MAVQLTLAENPSVPGWASLSTKRKRLDTQRLPSATCRGDIAALSLPPVAIAV